MKKSKMMYLTIGFIAGVTYLVACGSSTSSIAETIGNAIDVVYDNETSGLAATNVQTAIDEVSTSLNNLSLSTGKLTSQLLVGNWSGTGYNPEETTANLYLNADGTYSCSGQFSILTDDNPACLQALSWDVVANSIRLKYGTEESPTYRIFRVHYCTASILSITYSNSIAELTK